MQRFLPGLLVLVGLTLSLPCAASEDDGSVRLLAGSTSAWAQRPLVVEARLAPLGSPSGIAAVGVGYSPLPWLAIGGGVGAGLAGPQFEAMARLRVVSLGSRQESSAFYLGLGGSEGAFHPYNNSEDKRRWDHAWWGNLEVGFEKQWSEGVSLRVYAGNGWNLSRNAGTCYQGREVPLAACGDEGHLFPYAAVAVGYAF